LVFIVVRFAGAFFDSVSRGQTHLIWLPRELARPTGLLVRVGIVTLALVFAAPLITGDPQGALARVGTVTLVVFGLAATPLIACALVGSSVVYLRRVHSGEFVESRWPHGRVLDIGLLELRLIDEDGCEVRCRIC
jgi:small-conductance mechanosensitive channel